MFKRIAAASLAVAALGGSALAQADDCQICPPRRPLCRAVQSCAEAYFLLVRCGFQDLDRDRDGIPCEREVCGTAPQAAPAIPPLCAPRDARVSLR